MSYKLDIIIAAAFGATVTYTIMNIRDTVRETNRLNQETENRLDRTAWRKAYRKMSLRLEMEGIYADYQTIARDMYDEYEYQKIAIRNQ